MANKIDLARQSLTKGDALESVNMMFDCLKSLKDSESKKKFKELVLHSHNLSQLEKNRNQGLLSHNELIIETNKTVTSLIGILSEIEDIYRENKGELKIEEIDLNNSFKIPRSFLSDKLYHGFLISGLIIGLSATVVFLVLFYDFLRNDSSNLKELLFIASIGFSGVTFMTGTFDGLNRQKEKLIDWKLILPLFAAKIILIICAALLALFGK